MSIEGAFIAFQHVHSLWMTVRLSDSHRVDGSIGEARQVVVDGDVVCDRCTGPSRDSKMG